jgi:hypothetical protein
MAGQEPHLARHRAIPHDIHHEHILLPPFAIDQSLLVEANLIPHLELHPTAVMEGAVASPILGIGSFDVDHRIYQARDNARMIAPQLGSPLMVDGCTTPHSRWPIGGIRHLPGNSPIGGGSHLPGNNRPSCWQCSNASLLAIIHSHCPCRRGCHCASHNGIADQVPGLACKAVAARRILVGVDIGLVESPFQHTCL